MNRNNLILVPIWVLVFSTLLLVTARPGLAAEPKFANISLEGRQLSSNFRSIEVRGNKFINLPFLRVYFHIATSWDEANSELYFKFGKYNFKMYAKKNTYSVNGNRRFLKVAPLKKDGDFWIPLQFFERLGLAVKSQSSRKMLLLEWQKNYLLGIESISYRERPAFLIVGTKKLNLKHYTLKNPDRIVCELAETKPHFTLNTTLTGSNSPVKMIRIKTGQAATSCLVFDLTQPGSYRVIQDPQEPNQLIVVFNYIIKDIRLVNQDTDAKLQIKSSFPADYQYTALPDSNQLLVKFFGATFPEASKVLTGDQQNFRCIRISQDDPDTVSVLLETAARKAFFISHSHQDPSLIEIKSPGIINEVSWSKTETGSILTIRSNSELTENIRFMTASKQLLVDLENAQFDDNLVKILPVSAPINSIRLLPVSTNVARIETSLANLVAYNVKVSSDRHQIKILFKNPTLAGKTVVIDPGHGGVDTGACGKQNSLEKDLNLEVALKLKTLLEMSGAEVLLTRSTDSFIGLYERSYYANYHRADLFVSIHTNSHPDPDVRGIEVFYFGGQRVSQKMASKVLDHITKATGFKPLGEKSAHFVVIRETQMPSILVELGFLSNYQEESILKSTSFKDKAALGILQGLLDL